MNSPSPSAASEHVATLQSRIDEGLTTLVAGREPSVLYDPVRHVLNGGGKRLRPVILLLVAESYGASVEKALPAGLAVEVFHNFTLVHDDIMDGADERRGRATVHVKWDVGTAILAGDLMMGLSYDLLGQVEGPDVDRLYDVFHPMVERLCTGQALDASYEKQPDVSVDAYLEMIDGKTAALLAASFELGGIIGGAPDADRNALHAAGRRIGRAFQIQDDLLDLTADGDDWGKAVGGDLVTGKKTFLTLRTLERAEGAEYEWFARIFREGGLPPEEVPEARERMEQLDVFTDAREAVQRYTDRARQDLQALPEGGATRALRWLVDEMEGRRY